jgi:hypothetical protein
LVCTGSDYDYTTLSLRDVAAVQQGRINPIRSMDAMQAIGGIQLAVNYIAPVFGARKRVPDDILAECGTIARHEFGDLALIEIVQAYRLWAVQRFEALEMYGGEFNATQFSRVLSAYKKYRFAVRQALAREENIQAEEEKRQAKKEKFEGEYRKKISDFPQVVAEAINGGRFQVPAQIPVTWYKLAEANEMFNISKDEKFQFCLRAEKEIESERASNISAARNIFASRSLVNHYEAVGSSPIWNRAKQLILWEKLIGRSSSTNQD